MVEKIEKVAIIMNEKLDQVAVAKTDIPIGAILKTNGNSIMIRDTIKRGHRFALRDIKRGEFVRQYGYAFGQSKGILKGELITVSKIKSVLPKVDLKTYKKPGKTVFNKKYLNEIKYEKNKITIIDGNTS